MKSALPTALVLLVAVSAHANEVTVNDRHFIVPDGFTVELAAGPPLVERPITADFDEQGRLYVADSSGSSDSPSKQLKEKPHRIVRLTDSKGDGKFDEQTVFADHMMFPEGTLWYHGSLYVAAAPSIWKLTDTTGKGVADQRVEWFDGKTLTGCANDLHGPYLGPDGWIYWCKGAFAEQTYDRPGHKPLVTRAAHVFRARPDGTGIEPVMSGGMDNPVEVAFTSGGECIVSSTFLNNPEGGKRDGLIHALYGGIYPKIHDDVTDPLPHTFPDLLPVLTHTGPAAECALIRYEGDIFGVEYRDNLFAGSFNLHKVTRHVLIPDGATFKTQDSDFLVCNHPDFHPTHLMEDADGSLLVVDTGGWYKICCPTSQIGKPDVLGAIYRVRKIDSRHVEDPRGLKFPWDRFGITVWCAMLDSERPAMRRRAIEALANAGPDAAEKLTAFLSSNPSPMARLGIAWAAARIDGPEAAAIERALLRDPKETIRQAAAHALALRRDHDAVPDLIELLNNGPIANRRVAAEALGRIGDKAAVAPLLDALAGPIDHALEHSLTYALIEIAAGDETAKGLGSDNPHVRRSAMMALDQMDPPGLLERKFVAKEMSSADPDVRETAAWIAARHPDWGDALAEAFDRRLSQDVPTGEAADLLARQLARLARAKTVQHVIAEHLKVWDASRQIAIDAVGLSGLDALPAEWIAPITSSVSEPADFGATAISLRKLPAKAVAPLADALLAAGNRENIPPEARLDALAALPPRSAMPSRLIEFLIGQLAPEQPSVRKSLAALVLGNTALTDEQLLALCDSLRTAGPLEINKLLKAYANAKSETVGMHLTTALKQAKAVRALHSDMLSKLLAQFGPKVEVEFAALLKLLNPEGDQQKARLDQIQASLPAGDIRRGQAVFLGAKVSCTTCHAIGYVGGQIGPDLTRVGQIRTERDLLESIVYPSASFARGYEPYIAFTTSGDRYDGIVRHDDADGITILTGPNQETKIPRSQLKELRPGTVSIMPAGLDQQLSPQELADLLAFLKSRK